ncbi:nuclear transport factor 2 family protein [Pyxidicoccus sp. 3LG]
MSLPALAQTGAKATESPTRQIEAVVEEFSSAIVNKDKKRFLKLFLHEKVMWQSVTGTERLMSLRKKRPQAARLTIDPKNNPTTFIEEIVADKQRSEERFSNLRIDTDGDIASASFDFVFLLDEREINRGKESWHLVNTDDGWKIVSVIWSNN